MAVLDPTGPIPDEELFWMETRLALEQVFGISSSDALEKITKKRVWLRSVSPLGKAMAFHESPLLTAAALSGVSPEPEHFEKFTEALKAIGSLAVYSP